MDGIKIEGKKYGKEKPYSPGKFNPIHEVRDYGMLKSMIRSLFEGKHLPMVYTDGGNWLSGTHRVAAVEIHSILKKGYIDYDHDRLEIFDISEWLDEWQIWDEFNELWDSDSENACELLDKCENSRELAQILAPHLFDEDDENESPL
jgi:hypothetical protein